MALLSGNNITAAIEKGLAYLQSVQRPSGEFPTYTALSPDLHKAKPRKKSVYITTFVTHALHCLEPAPAIQALAQRGIDFLQREQEDHGAWSYEGRDAENSQPDLNNTCCAVAALAQQGHYPDLSFYSLLWQSESAPGGPFYNQLPHPAKPNMPFDRRVDGLVNANILFCCGLLDLSLPPTVYYLEQIIRAEAYQNESRYILDPHFQLYAITRAFADGGVSALELAMPALQNYILSRLPPPGDQTLAIDLACLVISLLNMRIPVTLIRPFLVPLLTKQQSDGSWPARAAYIQFPVHYEGSAALTTALAIEALGKYIRA